MALFRHHVAHHKAWPVGLAVAFVLGTALSSASLALPGRVAQTHAASVGATVGSGGGKALTGHADAPTKVQAHWSKTMPSPTAQEQQAARAALDAQRHAKVPVGPIHHLTASESAALARTAGPPLPDPKTAKAQTAPGAPQADSDLAVEQTSLIPNANLCPTDCFLQYYEGHSVANDGKHIMDVGYFYAAQSADDGATWSFLDPYTLFGTRSLCCAQQVLYEPSRDRMFWTLPDITTNNYSLILANSAGADLSNWCIYRIPPTALGFPSNYQLFPADIEYSANYLYVAFNIYDNNSIQVDQGVARFGLTDLANCASTINFQYMLRNDNYVFTLAQGATDTMYWFSNTYTSGPTNGDHVRVFFWPESSGSYTYLDKSIDPFNTGTTVSCASQDGKVIDWCTNVSYTWGGSAYRSRSGYRGLGAPLLSVAWNAGPVNGISPFPYVVRYYFSLASMAYKGHDNVYSPNFAVVNPALAAPSQRGYVGGTFAYGGGTGFGASAHDYYPSNFLLIEDPDTPSAPWNTYFITGYGNTNVCGCWGFFNTASPWNPDQFHWIADGWYTDGSGNQQPFVAIFGRGRDHNSYLRWANA